MKVYRVNQTVKTEDCPWLDKNVHKGTVVYEYEGYIYGCVSDKGTAVSLKPHVSPFFELSNEALSQIGTLDERGEKNGIQI